MLVSALFGEKIFLFCESSNEGGLRLRLRLRDKIVWVWYGWVEIDFREREP